MTDRAVSKRTPKKNPKRYPIREKGVWSLWGILASAEDRNNETAKQIVQDGMLVFYPSKKSSHGMLLRECTEVYAASSLMRNYRPKAIVGGKGSWVAIGPMDHGMFLRMTAEQEWEILSRHLLAVFGGKGRLMHIKAVVHIDGTRSVLGWDEMPRFLPYLELHCDESDTDAEAYVVDYEDYAPHPNEALGGATSDVEEDQTLITDFFKSGKKQTQK